MGSRVVSPAQRCCFYDSSSPYISVGKALTYASLNTFGPDLLREWSIPSTSFPLGYGYANEATPRPLNTAWGAHLPKPLLSPIAQHLTLQDINFKRNGNAVRTLDGFGDEFLTNHNVWVYVMSTILANEAVYGAEPTAPQLMMDAVGAVDEIFRASDWKGALSRHLPLLAHVVGDSGEEKQRLAA